MIKQPTKKQVMIVSGVLIGIAVILGICTAFLYQVRYVHSESTTVAKVADLFRMDMAVVDGETIPYSSYLLHAKAERTFLNSPMAKQDGSTGEFGTVEEQQAFDRALRVAAVDALAKTHNLNVTSQDVDAAFTQLLAQASSTDAGEIDAFLREQFGWSTDEFKLYVLKPAIIEETLRDTLSQSTGNPTAFEDALNDVLDNKTKRYLKF
ncbi:MAG: hypothetical protein H6759_01390 [Candidatus Nomurabacteria bacterium]|nr:MAG: hypothetical protein H6759_01390 [Candidatus Nomurabacteria bacterium]